MGMPELYMKIVKRIVKNWEYRSSSSNSEPVLIYS